MSKSQEPDANRPPSKETQEQYWDVWNTSYRTEVDEDSLKRGETVLELLSSLSLDRPRILEIGCSTGWLCGLLAEHGEVTGLDLSSAAVELARSRMPHVRFIAGDFLSTDFDEDTFDVVVSLETIAHVIDRVAFCDRVAELLNPGGHFIITTQNPRIWKASGVLKVPEEILQRFLTPQEFRGILEPRFQVLEYGTRIPFGSRGVLRFVNSKKLNRPFEALFGAHRIRALKESLGLGNTQYAFARKR